MDDNDIDISISSIDVKDEKIEEINNSNDNIEIANSDFIEGRYHRLELIPWWDQEKLKNAKILVAGAGALGNEIVKNLALLGVGTIFVIDMDKMECSNLSRSVFFRHGDEGKSKAELVALRAKEINPDINIKGIQGNLIYDIGLGLYRYVDLVIGGLDNREARLSINQNCWRVNRPWIDGAIEVLHGWVRVFIPPDGACYECTLNELDYKLLNMRKSCALLTKEDVLEGKIPTTPTVSSIIAGMQVQEAVKIIHNRQDIKPLKGKGFVYNGLNFDCYTVEYQRKEDCLSHETYEKIVELNKSVKTTTLAEMLKIVKDKVGSEAVLEFNKDIVIELKCNKCNKKEKLFKALGKVTEKQAKCHSCGEIRMPILTHSITGNEDYLDMTLEQIGIPLFDIVTGRIGMDMVHFEFSGDKKEVVGENN